jgi:tRNA(Ile)-lysidine synthase
LLFEEIVVNALADCPPGTVFLASVSGGADSTAMLTALATIRDRASMQNSVQNPVQTPSQTFYLRCIHIDHNMRPQEESSSDAKFVRSFCRELHVPCAVFTVKPGRIAAVAREKGTGTEAAARMYRHKAWRKKIRDIEKKTGRRVKVLTAHTADDMLETVLMRVLRGAGPVGLAAVPKNRGKILRPLLELNRSDVVNYLTEKGIEWREDASNADTRYFRNRVRHRLVPVLNELFPQWRKSLESLALTQSLSAEFITSEAKRLVPWQPLPEAGRGALCTSAGIFFSLPAIIREEALFQGINSLASFLPENSKHREVRRLTVRRFSRGEITAADLGRLHLRNKNGQIVIKRNYRNTGTFEYGFSLLINMYGSYNLKGITIDVCENTVDGNALLPLAVRPGLKDDFIERQGKKTTPANFREAGDIFSIIDSIGAVAFVSVSGLLLSREKINLSQAAEKGKCCMVTVTGKTYNGGADA